MTRFSKTRFLLFYLRPSVTLQGPAPGGAGGAPRPDPARGGEVRAGPSAQTLPEGEDGRAASPRGGGGRGEAGRPAHRLAR